MQSTIGVAAGSENRNCVQGLADIGEIPGPV